VRREKPPPRTAGGCVFRVATLVARFTSWQS